MTSATWPENVRRLADRFMKDPVTIFVGERAVLAKDGSGVDFSGYYSGLNIREIVLSRQELMLPFI